MLGTNKQNEVKTVVEKYLSLEKPKKSAIDKVSSWLQEKVPLEAK
jgi:hypothetical protein